MSIRQTRQGVRPLTVVFVLAAVFGAGIGEGDPDSDPVPGVSIIQAGHGDLEVSVRLWGPTEEMVERQKGQLLNEPAVQALIADTRHRLLSFELIDWDQDSSTPAPQGRYLANIYDYSRDRTIVVEGGFLVSAPPTVRLSRAQPLPNSDEFEEAVSIVREDPLLGAAVTAGELDPYRPMPPLIEASPTRTLAVGLRPTGTGGAHHQIVGVEMARRLVVRFPGGAPPSSKAMEHICEVPESGQPTSEHGEAGQVLVTVMRDGEVIWRLVVVRPSASSGVNGSGIELRHVEYLGKRVIERAHAPILNVKYEGGSCGPFRDWLWEEGWFDAVGGDVAPAFIECDQAPRTIADVPTDEGSFRGVAVHATDTEVALVSEMEAGWYRYTSRWILRTDGVIQPRFHFGAVANSCTCSLHNHHVYWRLDFALGGQGDHVVAMQRGSAEAPDWQIVEKEARFRRAPDRIWRVEDAIGDAYTIVPGVDDGIADDFGVGDVWVLRNDPSEIDDGRGFTTAYEDARAHLDDFVNGESVHGQDIVVWYAAHAVHDAENEPGIIGPDILPVRWTT